MGVALLEGGKLVHCGVKRIPRGRTHGETLKEGRKAVTGLIEAFRPKVMVIEKTFFSNNRTAAILNVFADEIKAIGKRKGLKVIGFAPSSVKKFICGNGRASKMEVATVIVSRYPELRVFLTQDRKWKAEYHLNMFDAIALGIMAEGR